MSTALSPAELERLRNICARLSSDFEGERAAAGLLATRLLRDRGLAWADVVMPATPLPSSRPPPSAPPWRETVRELLAQPGSLRTWERTEFLPNILGFSKLSPKQRNILDQISRRVLGRAV